MNVAARWRDDRPLHVMQVVHSLVRGGSERVACDLAMRLDRSRVRSSVCALDVGGPLAAELEAAGIAAHVTGRRPGRDARLIGTLYRLFRREQVDVVQTHHLTQLIYGALGARLAGATLVHVEHETFSLRSARARRRLRALSFFCDRVVAVGEEIRDFLVGEVRIARSRVALIRNGIDLARYRPGRRDFRRRIGLPVTERWIGQIARLEEEKDQATLLRAFASVRARHADTRLVLVGDGSLRASLEELARGLGVDAAVSFLGARSDVADLLPELDVFVLSSIREGLPLALLEAMACGVPVVGAAVGGLLDSVVDGVTGLLVPPRDPVATAAALNRVLGDEDLRLRLGRAAAEHVATRFGWPRVAELTETVYTQLADATASRVVAGAGPVGAAVERALA